jgi:hypothetical protein
MLGMAVGLGYELFGTSDEDVETLKRAERSRGSQRGVGFDDPRRLDTAEGRSLADRLAGRASALTGADLNGEITIKVQAAEGTSASADGDEALQQRRALEPRSDEHGGGPLMTWREDLERVTLDDGRELVAGSFRGVPFRTTAAQMHVGRRNVVNEYPQRDQPYVDDLGRRARRFVVDAFVIGDDYLDERDELIEALEEPGAGELIHPRYGIRNVSVDGVVTVRESPDKGGVAQLSITFVEDTANTFPEPSRTRCRTSRTRRTRPTTGCRTASPMRSTSKA